MALSPPPPTRIAITASRDAFGEPGPGAKRPDAEKPYRSKGVPSIRARVTPPPGAAPFWAR